jgi:cation transport regulator ChaC
VPSFVFGYGSLLRRPSFAGRAVLCRLSGHRRAWDVAMDNARTIPGYKCYLDAGSRARPDIYVTFLSIRPDPGRFVNGVAFQVPAALLKLLDRRERNYRRVEVTGLLDEELPGRVFTYVGLAQARERYERGRESGTAFVAQRYFDAVTADFRSLDSLDEFERTTDRLEVPRRDLVRLDVPERSGMRASQQLRGRRPVVGQWWWRDVRQEGCS